ncbi:Agmatine deiminase [Candidatus Bilamarchaeum dharawalense]|uniref:Agmatine deiminase n=1 Tax=Candidatus Bilamarchaeum dharawalense TaxID=2885759 RepID=A0A5E4LU06_9ARCH|nr:Agmatine deiminase [Candidatus Bilamarchaeum dharawalense]
MPAEWEPHEATWLSWPKDPETFPDPVLPKVEKIYIDMINALHEKEKVHLLVNDEKTQDRVQKMLDDVGVKNNVFLHKIKTVDVWMRDYGPIFVKNTEKVKITKWIFNAWGGKYEELMEDNSVVDNISPLVGGMEIVRPGIILEGGSIDVNGQGTLLTTEQCLLNQNRNHTLSRQQIEDHLKQHLGISNIVWLKEGIAGDDTDGHIDDIARFVNQKTVLCAVEESKSDENYAILHNNLETLKNAKDQNGESFEVKELPMPGVVSSPYGRLPASYANFYIGNGAVLLPVFKHKNDEKAISLLQECFPDRKIVPIYCEPLVWGLGAIHCVTQQQPL